MPHIFGIFPIIAGAALGWGAGTAIGITGAATAGALIGASVGGQIMGGQKAAEGAREQANLQNDAAQRRLQYDTDMWNMSKEKIRADREFAVQSTLTQAANEGRLADYKDAQAAQQYNYALQIRNREQQSNEDQFLRSEQIFEAQTDLNAASEKAGRDNERRQLEEIENESAFDANEAYLDTIVAEGKLRARGLSGRSAKKSSGASYADLGRQMELINESLSSAGRNSRAVLEEISRDRYSADLTAYAQKMLDPGVLPMPLVPLATPRATFLLPREIAEYDFGPAPVLGSVASPSAAANQVWGATISSIAGTAGSFAGSVLGKV